MQTLGASNPHNNNNSKHRSNTRITGETVDKVFAANGGLDNGVSAEIFEDGLWIINIFDSNPQLLSGAEEACWAHNPKVPGSKPG